MIVTNFRLYENKQQAESIIKKINISEDNIDYLKIKELVKDRPTYFGIFTKWFFENKTPFKELEELLDLLKNDKIKLDKPINLYNSSEELYDYLTLTKTNSKVQKMIKQLPSKARVSVTPELETLLSYNIKFEKQILKLYANVGGRYNPKGRTGLSADDLYKDTNQFIENLKGKFDTESMIDKIKTNDLNIDVVFSNSSLIVLCVNDYESAKQIGSQRWCIITSKNHWDNYVNDFTKQYIIFNFTKDQSDREHAIGVTVSVNFGSEPNKKTAMHWANDDEDGLTEEYLDELGKKHGVK